jgi:hypothetical protein
MAEVIAVCKSKEKGTRKKAAAKGILKEDYGLVGDKKSDVCERVWSIATDGK